MLAFRLGWQLR